MYVHHNYARKRSPVKDAAANENGRQPLLAAARAFVSFGFFAVLEPTLVPIVGNVDQNYLLQYDEDNTLGEWTTEAERKV